MCVFVYSARTLSFGLLVRLLFCFIVLRVKRVLCSGISECLFTCVHLVFFGRVPLLFPVNWYKQILVPYCFLSLSGNTPIRSNFGASRDNVVTRQYKDTPYHETEIVSPSFLSKSRDVFATVVAVLRLISGVCERARLLTREFFSSSPCPPCSNTSESVVSAAAV